MEKLMREISVVRLCHELQYVSNRHEYMDKLIREQGAQFIPFESLEDKIERWANNIEVGTITLNLDLAEVFNG